MLLSIILPTYNVSPFLASCLDSILNSGLSFDIYEIIIIDDGSTDDTGRIGEKYSLSYSHVFYFRQHNKGVSAARNYGLSIASNKYVWFIDPDDLVKSEMILDLIYMVVDNDLDAIGMNFYGVDEDGSLLPKSKSRLDVGCNKILSGVDFYRYNYKRSYIWQYIIRKEIFDDHNIRFKENMIMEDSEILPRLMANIFRIGIYEPPVYGYRRRSTSLLRNKSPESELEFMNSSILLAESIKNQAIQYSEYKGLKEGLRKKAIQVNQMIFLKYISGEWSIEQRSDIVNNMRKRGVFPFSKIKNLTPFMNFKLNAWRYMINLRPIEVSIFYKKFN